MQPVFGSESLKLILSETRPHRVCGVTIPRPDMTIFRGDEKPSAVCGLRGTNSTYEVQLLESHLSDPSSTVELLDPILDLTSKILFFSVQS